MIKSLIILTLFGLICSIESKPPSKHQHSGIIFPDMVNYITFNASITEAGSATDKKYSNPIKFPDNKMVVYPNNTITPIMKELQRIVVLPTEKYQSPIQQLFLQLHNNKTSSSEYKTLKKTSKSIVKFIDNILVGFNLRLSITTLKSGAG